MNGADTDGGWHHLAYVKKVNREESDKAVTAIFQDGVAIVSSPGCDVACWNDGATDIDWGAATIDDVVPITSGAFGAAPGGGNSNTVSWTILRSGMRHCQQSELSDFRKVAESSRFPIANPGAPVRRAISTMTAISTPPTF